MLTPNTVDAQQWLAASHDLSHTHPNFDWLGAVDDAGRSGGIRVIVQALTPAGHAMALDTVLDRDPARLDSLGQIWPGAHWCEREAAEAFGIEFVGGDARPLLLRHNSPSQPLRKEQVLAARVARPWPGAGEPGGLAGSRRTAPPGVPDPAVWGHREVGDPADPAEVIDSITQGRRRRR